MGGAVASLTMLADAATAARNFVNVFVGVYILLIIAYIVSSWLRLPYSPWLNRVQRFLYDVCDPYLRLFRRFLPPLGPIDLSPAVGIVALIIVEQIVNTLLNGY